MQENNNTVYLLIHCGGGGGGGGGGDGGGGGFFLACEDFWENVRPFIPISDIISRPRFFFLFLK